MGREPSRHTTPMAVNCERFAVVLGYCMTTTNIFPTRCIKATADDSAYYSNITSNWHVLRPMSLHFATSGWYPLLIPLPFQPFTLLGPTIPTALTRALVAIVVPPTHPPTIDTHYCILTVTPKISAYSPNS